MASGVHTSRIVRNTARIAESFGFEAHMTLFHKTIIMTLRNKENTHVYSMVNTAKAGAINFEINSDLSALSWEAYDNHLPLDQLWEKYHAITSKPRLNAWLVWVLVGFANASFCRLFSGDWIAVAAVFVATLVGFRLKQVFRETPYQSLLYIYNIGVCRFFNSLGNYVAAMGKHTGYSYRC